MQPPKALIEIAIGEHAQNGIPIVVKMVEMAVQLKRLTGQGVSRTSDYAKAPPEVIEEFLTHPKGL